MFIRKNSWLLGLVFLLSSCAQMAPPVPPSLELPKPVTDLKAVRKGDRVFLQWTAPVKTTDGESVEHLGRTHICRSFDEKSAACEIVGEAASVKNTTTQNQATFTDTLSPSTFDAGKVFNYSVSVPNDSGRSAGLSNRVQISATPTLPAPADFKVQVTGDGVVLSWASTSSDANLHRFFRIYRRQEGSTSDLVAGELPVDPGATQFVDHGFEWGKTYYYRTTVVSEVAGGMHPCGNLSHDCATVYQVEGEDTPTVKIFTEDVFPPALPSSLQAVYSGEGQKAFVDLVWAPNTEQDLTGYNVYRREEGGTATKLNSEPVKPPAYRDTAVQSGKKYLYSVTAVDLRGNESGRSEEASEQVP
jgi:hypothetical protein